MNLFGSLTFHHAIECGIFMQRPPFWHGRQALPRVAGSRPLLQRPSLAQSLFDGERELFLS